MKSSQKTEYAVKRFVEIARRYCTWAEGKLSEPKQEMQQVQLLLVELYIAALQLPDLGCGEDQKAVKISHDEWLCMYQKFAILPLTGYWDTFNPLEETEPVFNSLADDLADIYRDVKNGLFLYEAQYLVEAVWYWRFHFQRHWGQHLVGVQRAIHQYLTDEGL